MLNKILDKIFLLQIFLIIFLGIFNQSEVSTQFPLIYNFCYFIQTITTYSLIIHFIKPKLSYTNWMIWFVLFLVGIIVRFLGGSNYFLTLILMLNAAKGVETKKIIKVGIFATFVSILLIIMLWKLGVFPNSIGYKNEVSGFVSSFGFSSSSNASASNAPAIALLLIAFCHIYLRNIQWNNFDWLLEIIIFCACWFLFQSRMPSLILVLLNLVNLFPKMFHLIINSKATKISLVFIFSLSVPFSIYFMINYSNTYIDIVLNKVLTGRLQMMNYYYHIYGISIFGEKSFQKITYIFNPNYQMILDNGNGRMLIIIGALYFILFYCILYKLLLNSYKERKDVLFYLLLFIFPVIVVEGYTFINPSMNFFLIAMLGNQLNNKNIEEIYER